jgi:hypothetical protein
MPSAENNGSSEATNECALPFERDLAGLAENYGSSEATNECAMPF